MTWVQGDLPRTAALVADLLTEEPNNFLYRGNQALLLMAQGRYAESADAFQRSHDLLGQPFIPGWHAFSIGKAGDRARARQIAEDWTAGRDTGRFLHANQLSAAWLGAGEPERALDMVELGLREGEPFMMWTGLLPFHAELFGHPRFERVLDGNRFAVHRR